MTLIRLNCPRKQYNGLDAGTRRLVTALPRRLRRGGVKHGIRPGGRQNFESGITAVCAKNPGKALDGIR